MLSGDRERILNAAKGEKTPELRAEAIRQLGMMGAQSEIWQLYQTESSVEVKKQILTALWQSGNMDKVGELARNEKDHTLRLAAINDLGLMGQHTEPILLSIYASDQDPEVRGKVINALFLSGDAKGLVALARKETDPNMKKDIVSKLSIMASKDATDYLMEILSK
jgi:HEAT repeat protein